MIAIYTKPSCTYCTAAKQLMNLHSIKYEEVVIGRDITREDFISSFPTIKKVPLLTENGDILPGGYDGLDKLINEGYFNKGNNVLCG